MQTHRGFSLSACFKHSKCESGFASGAIWIKIKEADMPSSPPKVYLDHLIRRDSLLYKRTVKSGEENTSPQDYLQIVDLYGEDERGFLMRKPDFQRATRSWTPAECVELLEAVLGEQVVPSIILWNSPESLIYVLDGGHRISVLLAWVNDDWGESAAALYGDAALESENVEAARQVRELLTLKGIGQFKDWRGAARQYKELIKEDKEPALQMSPPELRHAEQFNGWKSKKTGFPILWVRGDHETAERSFLKINKTGRRLSEWETKLVENRSSSFARVVMSLANINDAAHCWPARDDENPQNDALLKTKTDIIVVRIEELNRLLFEPPFKTPIASAQQPLFAIPLSRPDLRPAYAAELLTITSGKKGRKAETEALISSDRRATATNIVNNASRLLDDGFSVLHHIYGQSPRSMTLMPLVYFYNPQGAYVRSLLYGMLFWLANGSETTEIADRKLLFTLHRKAFEEVLLKHKDTIITRIARRIGSGPEVTYPTARYFNELLRLLIEHDDQIGTKSFEAQHENLIETLQRPDSSKSSTSRVSTSRTFRGVERQKVQTSGFLKMFQTCEICGGRFYPGLYTEVDHIIQHSKAGPTTAKNGREVHPFCNNNRSKIEALQSGSKTLVLPQFDDPNLLPKSQQLSLLSLMEEHQDELEDEELVDEDEAQDSAQIDDLADSDSE